MGFGVIMGGSKGVLGYISPAPDSLAFFGIFVRLDLEFDQGKSGVYLQLGDQAGFIGKCHLDHKEPERYGFGLTSGHIR